MKATFKQIKYDLFGGLTSAIVALPLALAFGFASGLGPSAGLYGAIILGFVASLLGGTPMQISGPTGPMTVVVAGLALKYSGNTDIIFAIIILCGIVQILFGIFRFGAYINYVPLPVISGFMTGIGCIIILMEILPILGDYSGHNGLVDVFASIPDAISNINMPSLIIGLSSFLVIILYPKKLNNYIPSTLFALIIGTIAALYFFPDLKKIGEISSVIPMIKSFSLPLDLWPEIITSAFMLALLGSIDTLLTSTVGDKMTKQNHNSNKELIGQGIGNSLVGLMGGLAGAGATMRTVVNIKSGAKTRLSGMVHAIIILIIVFFMGDSAEKIPLCVLAGILLKVGFDIIDWQFIAKIKVYPKDKVFLMLSVLALTIFSDLVTSIGLGLILSHMIYSKKMHQSQLSQIQYFDKAKSKAENIDNIAHVTPENSNSATIKLSGSLNYSVTKDLLSLINQALSKYNHIVLDLEDIVSLDLSITAGLEGVFKSLPEKNTMEIKIHNGDTYKMFQAMGLFKYFNAENIHVETSA